MQRRTLLTAAGTTAVGLAGCLRGSSDEPDGAEWSHDVGGRVLAVSDGRVLFQESFRDDAGDGSIAASGERLWSYGSSNGYSTYTDPTLSDALYFGYGDDAVGSGSGELYAVELDGAERWTVDTGSVYERPRLDDGTIYVGSDDGVVRAVDAAAGDVLWRHEVEREEAGGPPAPAVEAVADEVYVSADRLLALDPATGDVDWRFGPEDLSTATPPSTRGRSTSGTATRSVRSRTARRCGPRASSRSRGSPLTAAACSSGREAGCSGSTRATGASDGASTSTNWVAGRSTVSGCTPPEPTCTRSTPTEARNAGTSLSPTVSWTGCR